MATALGNLIMVITLSALLKNFLIIDATLLHWLDSQMYNIKRPACFAQSSKGLLRAIFLIVQIFFAGIEQIIDEHLTYKHSFIILRTIIRLY